MALDSYLSYSYAEAGAAIGKLSIDTVGRKFDVKVPTFGGKLSYQFNEKYFATVSHTYTDMNDSDLAKGFSLTLDGNLQQTKAALGYAYYLTSETDLVFTLGGVLDKNNLTSKFSPGGRFTDNSTQAALLWSAGVRTIWIDKGFEGYFKVIGHDNNLGFSIGGPAYIRENMAIGINYTYMREKQSDNKSTHSSLGLTLRSYF